MPWVDWKISDLESGYMYCCNVADAHKVIPSIPDIPVTGLITLKPPVTPSPSSGTCNAGPCTCTCAKNEQGVYTCTCTCNDQQVHTM